MNLSGRRILVTGGGAGIGAAIAAACIDAGAAVVINDLDAERAGDMSQLLGATSVPGDAAGDGAADIVAAASEALGGLDGLVNNAGVVTASRLETVSSEEWDRVMHVNVRSVFQMSRAFAAVADVPAS
ncbi:MAG: SDR family NAD(P)-dependent oxidoreductase, partial [bacterium]|nr:SDR family NAD(P)-dependent oxidoreductase [bacterium]